MNGDIVNVRVTFSKDERNKILKEAQKVKLGISEYIRKKMVSTIDISEVLQRALIWLELPNYQNSIQATIEMVRMIDNPIYYLELKQLYKDPTHKLKLKFLIENYSSGKLFEIANADWKQSIFMRQVNLFLVNCNDNIKVEIKSEEQLKKEADETLTNLTGGPNENTQND
jgi:hypothetical protein